MYTKTNIESDVMAMYSPDKSMRVRLKGIIEHQSVNIPLEVCTETNIEGYVIAMYSPDRSTKVGLKGIVET